jgi:hypothetical protein
MRFIDQFQNMQHIVFSEFHRHYRFPLMFRIDARRTSDIPWDLT